MMGKEGDLLNQHVLRFHKDGHFRILEVSDFHIGGLSVNPKLKKGLEVLVRETAPDFVMIGGDQCLPVFSIEETRAFFSDIIEPILSRSLPFGIIFGNHDRETAMPLEEQEKIYEGIPGCLYQSGPAEIHGYGNYAIPVLASKEDRPAYLIWAMDSNRYITDYPEMFGLEKDLKMEDFELPRHFNEGENGATVLFDQVRWYYELSEKYEKQEGHVVPGVVFMHIPLPEFVHICQNPEECNAVGIKRTTLGVSEISSGMFLASLERRDIRGYFFGHEHLIDLQGEYCGITMACDGALGYNMSAHDDMRGGRIIDLYENGEMQTRMVRLMDLIGKEAMRDETYFEGGSKYFIRYLP